MEPKTTGRKIVCKREYLMLQGKRLWRYFSSVAALLVIPMYTYYALSHHSLSPFWFAFLMIGVPLIFLSASIKAAMSHFQDAQKIPAVVPLTRANTADLPAPDSLVRASSEPVQAQEAILLRAAGQEQQTPPEQLVRAVGGQEQDSGR